MKRGLETSRSETVKAQTTPDAKCLPVGRSRHPDVGNRNAPPSEHGEPVAEFRVEMRSGGVEVVLRRNAGRRVSAKQRFHATRGRPSHAVCERERRTEVRGAARVVAKRTRRTPLLVAAVLVGEETAHVGIG